MYYLCLKIKRIPTFHLNKIFNTFLINTLTVFLQVGIIFNYHFPILYFLLRLQYTKWNHTGTYNSTYILVTKCSAFLRITSFLKGKYTIIH